MVKDNGETKYLVVEIAFKGEQKHFRKVVRHARILEEHSGIHAFPVIACCQISPELKEEVDTGQVYWHYVPDHVLDLH